MEKKLSVEEYIEQHTRNYTNYTGCIDKKTYKSICYPWLTPDDARSVAKIAREEVIDKAIGWIKTQIGEYPISCNEFIEEFKKAMLEESV